jgi:hypothetical protein
VTLALSEHIERANEEYLAAKHAHDDGEVVVVVQRARCVKSNVTLAALAH